MIRHALLLAPLLIAGCYKTNLQNFSEGAAPGQVTKVWSNSFVGGLISPDQVDVRSTCGDRGVYSVTTQHSFVNILLAGITGGIYTPTTAVVTCNQ